MLRSVPHSRRCVLMSVKARCDIKERRGEEEKERKKKRRAKGDKRRGRESVAVYATLWKMLVVKCEVIRRDVVLRRGEEGRGRQRRKREKERKGSE